MKIASAAYPIDALDSWQGYADKIEAWWPRPPGRAPIC